MTRAAVLFLILGLAVGLWLGFNPQAHQQTIQQWDSVKSAFLNLKSGSSVQIRGLSSQTASTSSSKSSPKSRHAPESQPAVSTPSQPNASTAWKQVTTAFESFWSSLQGIWANITAKINSTR